MRKFAGSLEGEKKASLSEFLSPIIENNFKSGSIPAFVQMTSQLYEEVDRNTRRVQELEALNIPVKLIWGENDLYLNTEVAKDFHSHFKHSSLHILPAGHWLQIDIPDKVAAIMLGNV
jgi:pimeloyl-ACP methyl ester carboxylesterase